MKDYKESITEQILNELVSPLPNAYPGEAAAIYFVETLSECNLQCGLCAFGSRELFKRDKGMMNLELFTKIVDKIAIESPHAKVSPYHHSEPMLHPNLPEMVKIIKDHGLSCAIATNFNCSNRMEDMLKAGIDELSISVSGFYQETYQKSHIHGDIEKVKENLHKLRELLNSNKLSPVVSVNYHMYKDNVGDDFDKMQELCSSLGFVFSPSWARSINTEMSLKYLREKGLSRYQGQTLQWFDEIPALTQRYYDNIDRIVYLPEDYLAGKLADIHGDECPVNHRLINIRWNGKLSLCCGVFDDRFMTYDYLTTSLDTFYEMKNQSPFCRECVENNYAFYLNYVNMSGIDKLASSRLDTSIPCNRRFFAKSDAGEEIYNFCKKHSNIFIFGAGGYSSKVADLLEQKNIKYQCFLVSDEHSNKYDKENIKPLSYIDNNRFQNAGIIVALNSQNTIEVQDMLRNMGVDLCLAPQYL